jgi:hypothetical protein
MHGKTKSTLNLSSVENMYVDCVCKAALIDYFICDDYLRVCNHKISPLHLLW